MLLAPTVRSGLPFTMGGRYYVAALVEADVVDRDMEALGEYLVEGLEPT